MIRTLLVQAPRRSFNLPTFRFRTYTSTAAKMRQRLRLAILECDTPLPNTASNYGGGYGGVFKALLNSASKAEGHGDADNILDISTYQIEKEGATYPDLEKVDALLLTGSSMSFRAIAFQWLRVLRFCH